MAVKDKIVLTRLSYVIYQHTDLEKFRSFAKDFGLEEAANDESGGVTFFRGYGQDQYVYVAHQASDGNNAFLGSGFCAQSAEDFERASRMPRAEVIDMAGRPGGGKMVRIRDPNDYLIEVTYDQELRETPDHGISVCEGGRAVLNGALDKQRKGQFTRMVEGPAMVHKLGHFGYNSSEYDSTCAWYTENFNIRPTDVLYAPSNETLEVAAFFHLDLGSHSFEVNDLDTEFMGHQHLLAQEHELVWGIGRHVHGSQVFDYWYDSSRFIVEHYADGDLVNDDTEILRAKAGNMAVWGPPVPSIWGGKVKVSA